MICKCGRPATTLIEYWVQSGRGGLSRITLRASCARCADRAAVTLLTGVDANLGEPVPDSDGVLVTGRRVTGR